MDISSGLNTGVEKETLCRENFVEESFVEVISGNSLLTLSGMKASSIYA